MIGTTLQPTRRRGRSASSSIRRRGTGRLPGLAALAVGALAACALSLRQPEVELAGIRLAGLGVSGGTVVVSLSVQNPNEFPLEADGLTYHVELSSPGEDDWLELADGRFRQDVHVGAADSAIVEIPVEFSYSGLGRALRSLLDYGTVAYRLDGRIAVRQPLRRDVPYRHQGTVSVP